MKLNDDRNEMELLSACIGVRCPRGQHCILKQVFCIRAPCPPIPMCVDDRQNE